MSDERLMDGIRLTADAHDAGQLSALREIEALLEDLAARVRAQIAGIEARRDDDD